MKKLLPLSLILFAAVVFSSCSRKEVAKQEIEGLTQHEIDSLIFGFPFYVSKAYKTNGSTTVDVLEDPNIQVYQNAVFLTFNHGTVTYYTGSKTPNTQFPATAKTYFLNMRFSRPSNLSYHWDDTKKTIVVESNGPSDLPIIASGKSAYLDTSNLNITRNYEEAKNAIIPPSMTFIYGDYTIEMKPMWVYDSAPFMEQQNYVVVF
ncbi:hypothetical protein [Dyadobacter arcticus]|uniref:Uncharacterized protein n=1 Tax=Dyadobacter arcticus TaxID=1078754 RepID=A0ABX0UQ42_9BACT|nr:hypothetical protein [Dyadobacter arcticus]NIJ53790.1 hypothetical protein [Dyadobacter arcticus]